jgi:succinoglycan biosynthesis protein ExoV
MKITYYRGKHPNFGDELNKWMWPKVIPDFFDEDDKVLFIGTGSTIGEKYNETSKKIVFGSAFVPEYHPLPKISTDWDIYFVRGYRTAQLLNISSDLALGDSAILLRTIIEAKRKSSEVISFIPHWQSLEHGNWEQVCKLANINFIDPRRPVEEVISELLRSKLVIAEAMHGAIVSDALRIPWVPLLPINHIHRAKWFDWAEVLGINLNPHRLWPSSTTELRTALIRHPVLTAITDYTSSSSLSGIAEKGMTYLAAYRLMQLAKITACLSDDKTMELVTEKMLDKVQQLKYNYGYCAN